MNCDPGTAGVQEEKAAAPSFSSGDRAGVINPAELLARARIVKDSRSTKAGIVEGFFVKRYNHRGFFHSLKKLFQLPRPFRCRRSAEHLAAAGIPTPEVVYVCRDFLVTRAVDGVFGNEKTPSPEALASTLRAIHAAGVYHGDASMRNFYFTGDPLLLGVIDLDSARIYRKVPVRAVHKDIARAVSSFMILSGRRTEIELIPRITEIFLQVYRGGESSEDTPEYIIKRIKYLLQRSRK